MSEAEIKAEYQAKIWWLYFPTMWKSLGTVLVAQREIAHYQDEIDRVRSRFGPRKGRKPGSKNKPKTQVEAQKEAA